MAEVATTIDEQIKLLKDRGMKDHNFKEDTKFDYAIRLYYFDFDLRNLILTYIKIYKSHRGEFQNDSNIYSLQQI